jgi:hypothetical protein
MAKSSQVITPLSTDAGRLARIQEVCADLSDRLRVVCDNLSPEEFHALVRQIAELTVKYEASAELQAARTGTPPNVRSIDS